MTLAICKVTLANLMKEPSHYAELHSQLLYGEQVRVMETNGFWSYIETKSKTDSGWVLTSQLQLTEEETAGKILLGDDAFLLSADRSNRLISGSYISDEKVLLNASELLHTDKNFDEVFQMQILNQYLNAPYMWGGVTAYGIDCSGLSKMFFRFLNISLPHTASLQMSYGEVLDFLPNAKSGDLAFFHNEEGMIHHVGVLLGNNEIMHASESNGVVKTDLIDQEGIINKVSGKRTHNLRIIKRLF